MLGPEPHYVPPTEQDRHVFDSLVPTDHDLRKAAEVIDFERFRAFLGALLQSR
jgi:hypothetical protein